VTLRLLLDENARRYLIAVRRRDPSIDVLGVGDPGAPPFAALDPEVLLYCEEHQRLLVTKDRKSMPGHIAEHRAAGHSHWGVFRLRPGFGHGAYLDAIHLLWEASEAEEWIDHDEYIPWD
jgi:hypothetical protein